MIDFRFSDGDLVVPSRALAEGDFASVVRSRRIAGNYPRPRLRTNPDLVRTERKELRLACLNTTTQAIE